MAAAAAGQRKAYHGQTFGCNPRENAGGAASFPHLQAQVANTLVLVQSGAPFFLASTLLAIKSTSSLVGFRNGFLQLHNERWVAVQIKVNFHPLLWVRQLMVPETIQLGLQNANVRQVSKNGYKRKPEPLVRELHFRIMHHDGGGSGQFGLHNHGANDWEPKEGHVQFVIPLQCFMAVHFFEHAVQPNAARNSQGRQIQQKTLPNDSTATYENDTHTPPFFHCF